MDLNSLMKLARYEIDNAGKKKQENDARLRSSGLPTAMPRVLQEEVNRANSGTGIQHRIQNNISSSIRPSMPAQDPNGNAYGEYNGSMNTPNMEGSETKKVVQPLDAPTIKDEIKPLDKPTVKPSDAPVVQRKRTHTNPIGKLDGAALRRAFIMSEVLGKPVSKR